VDESDPVAVRRKSLLASRKSGGIAVDRDHPQLGVPGQQRFGVPAEPDGCVDDHRARSTRYRLEQLEDPVEQHRDVLFGCVRLRGTHDVLSQVLGGRWAWTSVCGLVPAADA
jgi:hypothetical protein